MKGLAKVAALSLGVFALAAPLHAQAKFLVGGSLATPLGDFDDNAKLGFGAMAGVSIAPPKAPVAFQVDGNWNQFGSELTDVKYRMIYGTGNAVYNFQTAATSKLHPYLLGGVGVYNFKPTGDGAAGAESVTKFGINAGAGFNIAAGAASVFVEGRFHDVFSKDDATLMPNLQFVPLTVGLRFGGK